MHGEVIAQPFFFASVCLNTENADLIYNEIHKHPS